MFVADEVLAKPDEKYMPPEAREVAEEKRGGLHAGRKGENRAKAAGAAEAPAKSPAGI